MRQDLIRDSNSAFDDFMKVMERIKALGPIPIALWFVDSEEDRRQFEQQLLSIASPKEEVEPKDYRRIPAMILGLSFHSFKSEDYDPKTELIDSPSRDGGSMFTEEYKSRFERVYPYICAFPGVWIEMSNNTYQRLEL